MNQNEIKFYNDGIELTNIYTNDELSFYLNKDNYIQVFLDGEGKISDKESLEAIIVFLKSVLDRIGK